MPVMPLPIITMSTVSGRALLLTKSATSRSGGSCQYDIEGSAFGGSTGIAAR